MKKTVAVFGVLIFLFPAVSSAAGLTYQQASSIIVLLEAFGVNQDTVNQVWGYIAPEDTPLSAPTIATTQNTNPQYQPEFGGTEQVQPAPITPVTQPVVIQCVPQAVFGYHPDGIRVQMNPMIPTPIGTDLEIPFGGVVLFSGQTVSSCTNSPIPVVVTATPSLNIVDPTVNSGGDSTLHETASSPTIMAGGSFALLANNHVVATTTGNIILSALGQTEVVPITFLPQ